MSNPEKIEDGVDATPAVAAESTHEGLPKKVLVAEDNVVSQQVAKHYLEAIGCNVVVVEDGHAAIAACARQEFGLVLMDLQMPRMDGLQATREIRRQERPGRHVPVLALTAKSASDELARCTAAGMNGSLFSGDRAFVRRLCQTFVTTTSQGLEELDGSVNAHRLAAIAANIESAAMSAALPGLTVAIDALRKAFDEATLHIGARLA